MSPTPPTKPCCDPNSKETAKGIQVIIEHYGLDHSQGNHFTNLVKQFQVLPTVDDIEFVIEQAGLRSVAKDARKMALPMFYFAQYLPWYVRQAGDEHRILVGWITSYHLGEIEIEVWCSWSKYRFKGENAGIKIMTYGSCEPGTHAQHGIRITESARRYVEWHGSFETLFQLSAFMPADPDDVKTCKKMAMEQNVHLKNVVKVLIRFPGLVMEPCEQRPGVDYQVNGDRYSKLPINDREPVKVNHPYEKLQELFRFDADRPNSKEATKEAGKRAHEGTNKKANKKQKSGRAAKSGPRVDEEDEVLDEEDLDEDLDEESPDEEGLDEESVDEEYMKLLETRMAMKT
ncbi:hypothetical protein E4T39_00257 [Aureobasidium subglaciale]|nr:hypothetical protein E4T39_00257 [Aureobasidium subglaciale]